jgi:hypothetical protein
MKYVNKSTVISVVVGMAVFGGLIYAANKSGIAAAQQAAAIVK